MAAQILIIEDDVTLNQLLVQQLERAGHKTVGVICWADAEDYLQDYEPSLIIIDGKLPDANGIDKLPELVDSCPVILLTAFGSVQQAVEAMRFGAADYLQKPVSPEGLMLTVERALENAALRKNHLFFKQLLKTKEAKAKPLIGSSKALQSVEALISAVAQDNITVLIQGESGTGKELIAREIHDQSERADHNFVVVDCCTLQEKLFESELFGHERGAFTGADQKKKGLIEGAEGGTLFLDEIGETNGAIQAKLLRVLETGIFRRLGGTKDLHSNVRIVSATNRDLEAMAADNEFRADLFYRLNGFNIDVSPLRERREDIPALVEHFIHNHNFSRRINKRVSPASIRKLTAYDWPGNVRELKNIIERAIILSGGKLNIQPEHLLFGRMNSKSNALFSLAFDHEPTLRDIEVTYLRQQLEKYSGRRNQVAEVMGVSERSVYRMIKRYGLEA